MADEEHELSIAAMREDWNAMSEDWCSEAGDTAMQTIELPETVRKALGPEAARDLATWLEEHLHRADVPPISALVARQKVNVLTLDRISNLLLADEPALAELPDGKRVWRVPVDLTFPEKGRAGRVGTIEVDAESGEVRCSDTELAQIAEATRQLAQRVLHPDA